MAVMRNFCNVLKAKVIENIGNRHFYCTDLKEATLYVHWPYCAKLCSYCNFNKYVRDNVDLDRMTRCLVKETETLITISGTNKIKTIYFGGGTPSLAKPETVSAILETVKKYATVDPGFEVTLEANPTTTERAKIKEFKTAGINRLSIGVQSLCNDDLKFLGRQHTAEDAIRCLSDAKELFPGSVTMDIMFGRPKQTVKTWKEELQQVMNLCDDHISLYQLTVERGTQLHKWVESGKVVLPDEDTMADLYELALEILEENGFVQYEVSNFARNGKYGRHNQGYWDGIDYIGVGPGAHGRFTPLEKNQREARVQILEPNRWMTEVEQEGHGTKLAKPQTQLELLEELIVMGLRTKTGIKRETWSKRSKTLSMEDLFQGHQTIQNYAESGLLIFDERGMRVLKKGLAILNPIVQDLLNVLSDHLPTG